MKKSKQALIHSVIALLLCVSMFVGTTFAWFTDSVTSMNNIIQSGTLDIDLEYMDAQGNWHSVNQNTNVFDEDALWEPGHTEVVYLRVINKGNLALKYQLGVNVASETPGTNVAGDQFKLSDYIKMGAVEGVSTAYTTRDEARKAVTASGTLASGYVTYGKMLANDPMQYIALVVYMPEEVDNVANYRGDAVPTIHLGINLLATQLTHENDSFGPDYDEGAKHPLGDINFTSTQSVADKVENGLLTEDVTVGDTNGEIYAEVPNGVKLADGADSLGLTVQAMQNSQADIQLEAGETANSLNVHMDGVAADNTVPMLITLKGVLKTGLNSTSVALYHVENGQTVPMTQVANPTNHNEFSYDPATGDVIMALKSFSEVVAVANESDPWSGTVADDFNGGSGEKDDPYIIANEDQFAYFRNQVDSGVSYKDKFVQLATDLNLKNVNFDPIGWGYVNSEHNRKNSDGNPIPGKVFKGTFDGGIYNEDGELIGQHTIFGLYQNGWDLEVGDADYTYTNCGFGLFAAASDATFKNLTISGARITVECVEAGILVGLSQGACTYENISIYDSKIANYQRPAGGLIGEISGTDGGTTTITNVTIGPDVVVGSLWGDFDTPVGGVIGARWLDGAETYVTMENVTVAARLDVYSDVTAAYQWYAYRRAGMLIGNTDTPPANGKDAQTATAAFLTCKKDDNGNPTVKVYYGDWVNYHYCEFTNENNPGRNYPWVRVEAGENCSAYSNPRYGQPLDVNGNKVVDANHKHQTDDTCKELIKFGQLYGGGQGVYGQPTHEGVQIVDYLFSITFVNDSKVYDVVYVTEDKFTEDTLDVNTLGSNAKKAIETAMGEGYEVDHWMNAGSTAITSVSKDESDLTLYPSFKNRYAASFVDLDGNILAWDLYVDGNGSNIKTLANTATAKVPSVKDCTFDYWEVRVTSDNGTVKPTKLSEYKFGDKKDITIYPVYTYDGDVNLIPIDNNGDGVTDEYQVGGYSKPEGQDVVEIPASVNGKEVTTISNKAFATYKGVHVVVIPKTIRIIGDNTFSNSGVLDSGETVTLYYEGSYQEWLARNYNTNWYEGLGTGSRLFFMNGGESVDPSQGYIEIRREFKWAFSGGGYHSSISYKTGISQQMITDYSGECKNCDIHPSGTLRPDAIYWEDVKANA